jgi:hypothetical protein
VLSSIYERKKKENKETKEDINNEEFYNVLRLMSLI